MENNWIQALASCAKVKLPNGLVGKLSKVLFMAVIVFGIIIGFSIFKNETVLTILLASMLFVILIVFGIALLVFASKHPESVLLEGAEFIKHEQIQILSKNNNQISTGNQTYNNIIYNSDEELKSAELPDSLM